MRMRVVTAVVVFTLGAAGCSSADGGGGGSLQVLGTNGLQFEPAMLSGAAGTVTVELTAEDAVEHTFVVEEAGDTEVVTAAAGETATGTIDLEPGTYTYYCSVEGHRSAGMEGELTVS